MPRAIFQGPDRPGGSTRLVHLLSRTTTMGQTTDHHNKPAATYANNSWPETSLYILTMLLLLSCNRSAFIRIKAAPLSHRTGNHSQRIPGPTEPGRATSQGLPTSDRFIRWASLNDFDDLRSLQINQLKSVLSTETRIVKDYLLSGEAASASGSIALGQHYWSGRPE